MFFIGDCEEHNRLAGRYGRNFGLTYLVRDCFTKSSDSSDPNCQCDFIESNILQILENNGNIEQLHKYCFHSGLQNSLHELEYGGDTHELNGCLPPEPLHLYQLRICDLLIDQFLDMFSDEQTSLLNVTFHNFITRCYHQSERNIPDIQPFKTGLKLKKNLQGTERFAQVFALYLFLITDVGATFFNEHSKSHQNSKYPHSHEAFVYLLENTLVIYQWLTQDEFPKDITQPAQQRQR